MHSRNRLAAMVTGTAIVALCVLAVAAFASGTFTWNANFNSTLRSRDYSTPNVGNHRIKSYMSNPRPDRVSNTYYIKVVRNRALLPDVSYGEKRYYANQDAQTKTWTNIDCSGTFHFDFRRYTIGGAYYTGNGQTWYP